jgi:hypothetical protein
LIGRREGRMGQPGVLAAKTLGKRNQFRTIACFLCL